MATDPYHIDDLAALLHEKEWGGSEGWPGEEEEEEEPLPTQSAPVEKPGKYLVAPVDLYLPDDGLYFATYGEAVEAAKEESWNDSTVGVWHPADASEKEYDLLAIIWQQRVYRLWSE